MFQLHARVCLKRFTSCSGLLITLLDSHAWLLVSFSHVKPSRCCSSMFFDEDGDLAHEFYEETIVTKNGRKKAKLKKIQKNLTPQVSTFRRLYVKVLLISKYIYIFCFQGTIKLDHPCIHVDFPVILCETWWLGASSDTVPLCQLRPVVSPADASPNHLQNQTEGLLMCLLTGGCVVYDVRHRMDPQWRCKGPAKLSKSSWFKVCMPEWMSPDTKWNFYFFFFLFVLNC